MRSELKFRVAVVTGLLALAACDGTPAPTSPNAATGCTACHGDSARVGTELQRAAPPLDARSGTDRTLVTVGAHQAHVYGGVACATCHTVPAAEDRTHIGGPHATVLFSGNVVGAQGAAVAPWNRDRPTCANYCHGDFTNGNRSRPTWTSTTGVTCNSCHGAGAGAAATPPGGTHPQGKPDCSACHTGYTTTTVNPDTHVNGRVELAVLSCSACHGDATRPGTALEQAAPPFDTRGLSGTNEVTVGAHQGHLSKGVACATCHVVPPTGDITHGEAPTATVVFSGNRVGANATPVAPWNRDQPTCANYCHGPAMGGTVPRPLWTRTTPLGCAACHWDQQSATTSTGLHVFHVTDLPVATRLDCGACHGTGYAKAGVSGAALVTHSDGLLQILPVVGWQDPSCVGPRTCFAACHTVCRNWP